MLNPVLSTAIRVVKNARDVKINRNKTEELAKKWAKKIAIPKIPENLPLETKNQKMILDYLIMLDSINFCFWSKKDKWYIPYKGKEYDGYFALSLSLKRFFEDNPNKANLEYFSKISFKEFSKILKGRGELQFLKKRWQIVRKVSSVLIKKYGDSINFVLSARGRFSILVPKISKELPFFNDTSYYSGQKVYFYKRSQILSSDICSSLSGKGLGFFKDPGYLTAFADYKLPQILKFFGVLEYSIALERKIKNKIIIPAGSKQEVEIRSATVLAVEYLRKALLKLGKNLSSSQIDWILWVKTQEIKIESPYHLTRTIYY